MTALVVSMQHHHLSGPSFEEYHSELEDNAETRESDDANAVSSPISQNVEETENVWSSLEERENNQARNDEGVNVSTQEPADCVVVKQVDKFDNEDDDSLPLMDDVHAKYELSPKDKQEDIPLPSTEPTDTEEDSPALPFGGLNNLGNTCYLNSALQMVASLDKFAEQIQKHIPTMDSDTTGKKDETLREALLAVLERLGHGETFSPISFKSIVDERSPLFIGYRQQDAHEFLTTLLDLLDEDYKKIPPSEEDEEMIDSEADSRDEEMNDATASAVKKQRLDQSQETTLLHVDFPSLPSSQSFKELEFDDIENLLHGDGTVSSVSMNRIGKKEGPKCKLVGGRMHTLETTLTRWDDAKDVAEPSNKGTTMTEGGSGPSIEQQMTPFSPVNDYFNTEVRVCLTCDSCKYRRSHTETYLHLSLEIGPAIGSIEEGLRSFFKAEKRDVKCEKCFSETATQTTEITKLPRALLFHLKRFIVDVSPDYTSISYRKNQTLVSFEPYLELDEHSGALGEVVAMDELLLPQNSRYAIRSVVNHIGSSASCGHYTADAVRIDSNEQSEWIRFNDSYVTKISPLEAVNNAASTAYMVLYELESLKG